MQEKLRSNAIEEKFPPLLKIPKKGIKLLQPAIAGNCRNQTQSTDLYLPSLEHHQVNKGLLTQVPLWLKTLHQNIKGNDGPRWELKDQYSDFKIGKVKAVKASHGRTPNISTDQAYTRDSYQRAEKLIAKIVDQMDLLDNGIADNTTAKTSI